LDLMDHPKAHRIRRKSRFVLDLFTIYSLG
jgi:hypothetical protein